ncbi:MAG: Uncharacterized protein JWM40_2178 [Frankiales bacterium]|nr:Uncharacterized protein [Frankiales bacterium]
MTTLVALAPALVFFGLLVWLLVGARRPATIELEVVDEQLVLRLHGRDAFYAMSRGMTIPLTSIKGVAVAPRNSVPRTGLRLPGTSLPGLRAGSFGTRPRRDFWLVRTPDTVLVVELQPDEPYRRLVLEVPDPRALCLRLRPRTGAYTGTFSD